MARFAVFVGLLVVSGCVSVPPPETVIDENKFDELFGDVPVIRRGMHLDEVRQLVGDVSPGIFVGSNLANFRWECSCGIRFDNCDCQVGECQFIELAITGQRGSMNDAEIAFLLHSGLTPREVEQKIEKPTCGFSNTPGTVHILYKQAGIEVVFVEGRLLKWKRVITYKEEATDKR
jgi:hypothetical protein